MLSETRVRLPAAIHKSENKFGLHKSENEVALHKSEIEFNPNPPNPEAKSWVKTLRGLNFRISIMVCVCVCVGGGWN